MRDLIMKLTGFSEGINWSAQQHLKKLRHVAKIEICKIEILLKYDLQ